jgi:DNA (cytosine-5)-methyltransferase 1
MSAHPRLLDLFCGAGGAAMGYHRAGFEVVGVDIAPQPRYPFEFHQADALSYPLRGFDVIHASPPCQFASRATAWRGRRSLHLNLIPDTRTRLVGHRYVLENVQEARRFLIDPIRLCGSQFGIAARSHRFFEVVPLEFELLPPCFHRRGDASRDHGVKQTESAFRDAIGCGWMRAHDSRHAVPPAYTEWLGRRLLAELGLAA